MTAMDRRDALRLLGGAAATATAVGVAETASALELGKTAPDFTLPSATGEDVSLKQYRGQKLVLIEFFGAAFAPT